MEEQCLSNIMVIDLEVIAKLMLILNYKSFFLYLYRYIILLLKFQIGQGFGMVHFTKCSPTQSIVRKAMLAMQDSMPLRLHRVHFLHAPAFIESILNIFYPLLKVRLVQKVSGI